MGKDGKTLCLVRISAMAKSKLELIAERKNTTLSEAASQIILHHAANGLDYETSSLDDVCQSILKKVAGIDVQLFKLIGPVERTEDFIKSLLRENRNETYSTAISDMEPAESGHTVSPEASCAPRTLDILGRLLAMAKAITDFDGRAAMQIRLSQEEFSQIKLEYDQLCISRNL